MRNLFASVLALCLALTARGYAQSPGSYAGDFQGSMNIVTTSVCSPTDTSCLTGNAKGLLAASIKVSTGRSLAITGSLETALLTDTSVSSNNGNKSSSTASGSIVVTPVLKDSSGNPYPVYPNQVTYNSRTQTLTATLGQACFQSATGVVTCTGSQTIDLLLSTMSANSYLFIAPNLPEGVYTLSFNINVTTAATSDTITSGATAQAAVYAGSLGMSIVQVQTPFNSLNYSF